MQTNTVTHTVTHTHTNSHADTELRTQTYTQSQTAAAAAAQPSSPQSPTWPPKVIPSVFANCGMMTCMSHHAVAHRSVMRQGHISHQAVAHQAYLMDIKKGLNTAGKGVEHIHIHFLRYILGCGKNITAEVLRAEASSPA